MITLIVQSIPGLVVESSCDAEIQVGDASEWLIVNSSDLLEEIMVSDVILSSQKFGRELNLAVWQFVPTTAKLKIRQYFSATRTLVYTYDDTLPYRQV